ncbi:MAG: Type 1 glutamine amidotransferase-like domain-containing protein [Cephaloticoccus sp.]|nr:Type 1 glutamine amidotransferase-like domain-containing protein [Cephaloticoccus sp.]MCF7759238.1 Type 1 glutamine amidotransferase-like domain-containing protein [Cephaloticoccus sp.]
MIAQVARAVARDLGEITREPMAYIGTAAETASDQEWPKLNRAALVDAGFQLLDYTITGKSAADLRRDLAGFPILFFEGGDPFYLLEQMQKMNTTDTIRELAHARVYIGCSAGATIAGPDIFPARHNFDAAFPHLKDTKGLGLVDILVLNHWGSDFGRKIMLDGKRGRPGRVFHNFDDKFRRVFLADNQYLDYENGRFAFRSHPDEGGK